MLSVWNKVNKRMMQRLKTDPDAPYPKLYLTSTDSSSAPTQFPCLYIKSLGEPTAGRDFQNTGKFYMPDVQFQYGGLYHGAPMYLPIRLALIEH